MKKIDENYFVNNQSKSQSLELADFVDQDEQILWQGKPNKKAYILNAVFRMMPFALVWLIFDSAFIGAMIGTGVMAELPVWAIVAICVFFAFHLIPVWFWIGSIVTATKGYKNLDYAFTNKRIIVKSGIIGIDYKNIYYPEIQSVNLKVGIIDRLLKVGDVYVKSVSSSQVLFDISDPYFITKKLQEIVVDIKSDIEFPNELRPLTNPGYRTKYTKNEDAK